jgi:2-keto-3-deoxy-L-rhamnonate aldolase RhmA
MPLTPSLKQRIRNGETVVSLRPAITSTRADLERALSKGKYDFIYIDGQHTAFSEDQLVSFCTVAQELGYPVQMRIPHTQQAYLVGRYMDLGLTSVMVPEVETEEIVDEAIAFSYYPQFGKRSWGGAARRSGPASRLDYAKWWNEEEVVLCVQLESIEAISTVRHLAKPGVDYFAFVPVDLTFSLEGHPEFPLRTVDECMKNVADQVLPLGFRLGMAITTEPDEREKYLAMGITVFQEAPRA